MGHSHALGGALVFAGSGPLLLPSLIGRPLSPGEVLLGTLLSAGAALLPDADHPDGTVAHLLGPVTRLLCRAVGKISGGHRHATHSLLFAAAATAGAVLGVARLGRPFVLGLVLLLLFLALRALHLPAPGPGPAAWTTAAGLAALGTAATDRWIPGTGGWLPYAVGLGVLAHLLGDFLTRQGIPLFWPHRRRYEVVLIRRSGNGVETRLLVPLMTVATFVLLWFGAFPASLPAF
ncbi:metal-dependent hydrolase [Kitasatospora sp. NE20-6]|uniref:metal-dependent hydrolase n=1 Tax=Kitasatospora sp. NE20-6 TaxID=2859066 RepID=UPI0038B2D929